MNVVVDSSGWIEFFVDGPNATWFGRAIRDATELVVPSITVLEVYRYVLRHRGRQDALQAAWDKLSKGGKEPGEQAVLTEAVRAGWRKNPGRP